jgi:type I restriction enzyme R subunit
VGRVNAVVEMGSLLDRGRWTPYQKLNFFLASQLWISGEYGRKRADLVCFVNGLPIVFIELKASHRRLADAYEKNLSDYKTTVPQIFWYNGFLILSNGSKARFGSITAGWEHFSEWKKINSEGEEGIVSLETMIRGVCDPVRLLDLLENFVLYSEVKGELTNNRRVDDLRVCGTGGSAATIARWQKRTMLRTFYKTVSRA